MLAVTLLSSDITSFFSKDALMDSVYGSSKNVLR